LIERNAGAECEQQDRDDETPEIDFAAISERMFYIRSGRGPTKSVEKQETVSGVDGGVHTLAEQG
jgi:hypothetical protein